MDFGILEPILADPDVTEIMINGYQIIFYEKKGKLIQSNVGFESEEELLQIVDRILSPLGRKLDESHPICDVRLADGSRVHIVGRPISLIGPAVAIRKFLRRPLTLADLLNFGAMTENMAELLKAAVEGGLNIAIVGGGGSGKTALMHVLCQWIHPEERIITIEQAAELQLNFANLVPLEYRPPNLEGRGEVTMRQLLQSALKMRPERLLVNELRGPEALELIQAMNTGHNGSIFNLHATTLRDALIRLEIMMSEASPSTPVLGLREGIASALELVVLVERMIDGSRRVRAITEILGINNGVVDTQDIFVFEERGSRDGTVHGQFTATGRIPRLLNRLPEGRLPLSLFNPLG